MAVEFYYKSQSGQGFSSFVNPLNVIEVNEELNDNMKMELNSKCQISTLNDLQENNEENPVEKKKNALRRHYVFPQSKNVRRST